MPECDAGFKEPGREAYDISGPLGIDEAADCDALDRARKSRRNLFIRQPKEMERRRESEPCWTPLGMLR